MAGVGIALPIISAAAAIGGAAVSALTQYVVTRRQIKDAGLSSRHAVALRAISTVFEAAYQFQWSVQKFAFEPSNPEERRRYGEAAVAAHSNAMAAVYAGSLPVHGRTVIQAFNWIGLISKCMADVGRAGPDVSVRGAVFNSMAQPILVEMTKTLALAKEDLGFLPEPDPGMVDWSSLTEMFGNAPGE